MIVLRAGLMGALLVWVVSLLILETQMLTSLLQRLIALNLERVVG